jgi:hypothetical protein
MDYRIGDEVVLKINFGTEENPRYDRRKVQVIGLPDETGDGQYLCYVPNYLSVPQSFKVRRVHQEWYGFDDKFLDEQGTFITDACKIYAYHPAPEGECCDNCKRFIRWAERDWSETFVCRRCTQNPYR